MPDLAVSKVPFWSAIITPTEGTLTVGASATAYLDIRPPAGETWLINILTGWTSGIAGLSYWFGISYYDYDGTTARYYASLLQIPSSSLHPFYNVAMVITNSRWARIGYYNGHSSAVFSAYYGYSGFKLSQPIWFPQRPGSPAKPFKLPTDLPLPDPIKPLDKYKALILGLDPLRPDDYELAVVLEEDTPLAFDPASGFPVERLSVYVSAKALADLVLRFRRGVLDPVKTGYKKYLDKWESEGIKLI